MPIEVKPKVLFVNPVGSADDNSMFAEMAREYKNPATTVGFNVSR